MIESINSPSEIYHMLMIGAFLIGIIYKLWSLHDKFKRLEKIVYQDTGGLNLIKFDQCKMHRDNVYTAIRRGENETKALIDEMKSLNENVLRIMFHLKIETKNDVK